MKKSAKDIILTTATSLFAEKTYHGASMDQIAKEAKVTKSLIYYHFKSKEEILKTLVNNILDEFKKLVEENMKNTDEKAEVYLSFAMKHESLIRIIFIESLKDDQKEPMVFDILDALMSYDDMENSQRIVEEFYTNIIPMLSHICFRNAMSSRYTISHDKLSYYFKKAHKISHGAIHKAHEGVSNE